MSYDRVDCIISSVARWATEGHGIRAIILPVLILSLVFKTLQNPWDQVCLNLTRPIDTSPGMWGKWWGIHRSLRGLGESQWNILSWGCTHKKLWKAQSRETSLTIPNTRQRGVCLALILSGKSCFLDSIEGTYTMNANSSLSVHPSLWHLLNGLVVFANVFSIVQPPVA